MTKKLLESGSQSKIMFYITPDKRLSVQKEDLWTVWTYLFTGKFVDINWTNKQ